MTIIETAKFNGLDPQADLADILARINDQKVLARRAAPLELDACRVSPSQGRRLNITDAAARLHNL